jgi:tight adherence protein B
VVELVFALAAELRAGHPPRLALAAAAASSGALERPLAAATTASSGLATVDELRRVASLPGCRGLDAVAAAWEVTDRVGGPVADVLDRLGAAFDAEIASRETLDAILAGPRATMTLLAALPVVGVALGESIGAHPVRLLLHQPLGWALLGGAVAMDLAGVAWVAALSRRALRG